MTLINNFIRKITTEEAKAKVKTWCWGFLVGMCVLDVLQTLAKSGG